MARRKEDVLVRIARHTGHTVETLTTFLADKTDQCLLWNGCFSPKQRTQVHRSKYGRPYKQLPKPHLKNLGNPVRSLFDYPNKLDHLVFLRNECGDITCINPTHYRPQATYRAFEDRVGVLPTRYQAQVWRQENIEAILQMLLDGIDPVDFRDYCEPEEFSEALERFQAGA